MWIDPQTLQDSAVALGLATLSGYSLYGTAFLTGLAMHFGWFPDFTHDHLLSALAETPVLTFLFGVSTVEFLAGKVRFLGSIWDVLHTLVRPVGAAILAAHAYQHHGQASEVLVALLGGTAALGTHSLRTAGNLAASHLPLPFANFFVSGAASIAFLAAFALYLTHAVTALAVFTGVVALSFWMVPKFGCRLWRWYRRGKKKVSGWKRVSGCRGIGVGAEGGGVEEVVRVTAWKHRWGRASLQAMNRNEHQSPLTPL